MAAHFLNAALASALSVIALHAAQADPSNQRADSPKKENLLEAAKDLHLVPSGSYSIYPDQEVVIDSKGNTYEYKDPKKGHRALKEKRDEADLSPLESFATQFYFHGVPYEEAIRFKGGDYKRLTEMLRDPDWKDHWSTIATVLGMVGDEAVVDELISFIETPVAGKHERELYSAKRNAVAALGYPLAHFNSPKALGYLKSASRASHWDGHPGLGRSNAPQLSPNSKSKDSPQADSRVKQLARMSLQGLSKGGTDESVRFLKQLRAEEQAAKRSSGKSATSDEDVSVIDIYIEEAERVKSIGLYNYHRNNRR